MTVLSKDTVRTVTQTTRSSLGASAYVSTATYYVPTAGASPEAVLPGLAEPPEVSTDTGARSIRQATAAEVTLLKSTMFPSVAEPTASEALSTARYSQDLGVPLLTLATGDYVALWYGDKGLGYYVFSGYTGNHPTQTITITPTGAQYG